MLYSIMEVSANERMSEDCQIIVKYVTVLHKLIINKPTPL